jgi:hypothetical protein
MDMRLSGLQGKTAGYGEELLGIELQFSYLTVRILATVSDSFNDAVSAHRSYTVEQYSQ